MIKHTTFEVAKLIDENNRLRARAEKAEGRLEYVAMMTDVELPEEEEEAEDDE